ncbi:hypothetical protein ANME2D_02927 [Candidatus Methanoperedens nitroreducens]|uniref:Dual OB-containing domain-containing protein n=1 Tax=Candidatus Methanoperedens nitratireducens TaxID=1392998 RepID=A0A062UV62_9EURY|nr:hypothetical protein [Candidatus Methanoperedens nitroreducens]KCZ70901.1 hypothetical protein ANME2D_02927 [Candidatus Methanoperedens nitroreducens]MDJ1421731.1 hypothetical protein [Candidatus Methanoperedens sp.]
MMTEIVNLHVLAIARPTKSVVCVAGINDNGEWIRPQRIFEDDIKQGTKINFDIFGITKIYVEPWKGKTIRPEDRYLIKAVGKTPELTRYMSESEIHKFLESHLDSSVESAFNNGRTLGLIKPRNIIRLYSDINKIRITFQDSLGNQFTWPVRDESFYKKLSTYEEKYPANFVEEYYKCMQKSITYFAIGLTQIYENNINAEYGGWPMIVGIHCLKRK